MKLREKTTGKIINDQQFRKHYPNIAFPKELTQDIVNKFNHDIVIEKPKPDTGILERALYSIEQNADGNWEESWSVVDKREGLSKSEKDELLENVKNERIKDAEIEFHKFRNKGIVINSSYLIETTHESHSELQGVVSLLNRKGGVQTIRTRSKEIIKLNVKKARKIRNAVEDYLAQCYKSEADIVTSIENASSIEEVLSVNVKSYPVNQISI